MKKIILAITFYLFYGVTMAESDSSVYKYSLAPFFSFDNYNFEFIEQDDSGPKNFKYSNTQIYSTGIQLSYSFKERLFIKGGIGYLTKNFQEDL